MKEELTQEEKIKKAKSEYMKKYRRTASGKAAIKKANARYWEKKFDELEEAFKDINN